MSGNTIVLRNVLSNRHVQMTFAKQDESVKTLAFNREHKPFSKRIQVRAPCWKPDSINTFASE